MIQMLMMTMMLFQLHAVNNDVIDDEKNFRWFIDVPVSVPDVDDDASLLLLMMLYWAMLVEYPSR